MLIYSQSVEGSSHKISGTPCQDYSICKQFDKFSIIAISDGHGSKTYVRSNIGSKLACEIAVKRTQHFIEENYSLLASVKEIETYSPDYGVKQNSLFANLFEEINYDWELAIIEDSTNNPFTPIERSLLGSADIKHAYGCTLMVAVKSKDFTFIFHIGDGRIFTVSYINEWEQPVPWDKDCEDNVTTSLCENDPIYRFRYYFNPTKKQPFIIFLCSDGIEDCYGGEHNGSFKSEDLIADYGEVIRCFLEDEDFQESCVEFLDSQSKRFSHDDMSIAFIIDDNFRISKMWLEMNGIRRTLLNFAHTIRQLMDKINGGKERICLIKKNINRFESEIERLNAAIDSLDKEIHNKETKLSGLEKCSESGYSFKTYIEEFPKKVNEYNDSRCNNKSVALFLKKLTGSVLKGLSSIIESIQKDILSNEREVTSLSKELEGLRAERAEFEKKSKEYLSRRESELGKLTGLEEEQQNLRNSIEEFKKNNSSEEEMLQNKYETLKQDIIQILPNQVESVSCTMNNEESITNDITRDTGKLYTLNICRFSSLSQDEDIIIQTNGEKFNASYNGKEIVQIDKISWDELVAAIKSINKDDILPSRTSNCIVISTPDTLDEKCISLNTESARILWELCLSLVLDK